MRCLAIVVLALAACTGGSPAPSDTEVVVPEGEACSAVIAVEDLGAKHIAAGKQATYNSDPPTSGPHWGPPDAPHPVGAYPEPVRDEVQVHNLEHGHVVVQYRDLADEEFDAVSGAVLADPDGVLMAPRPTMDWKLTLTAWTRILVCDEIPDDVADVVRAFVTEHRDNARAPEANVP